MSSKVALGQREEERIKPKSVLISMDLILLDGWGEGESAVLFSFTSVRQKVFAPLSHTDANFITLWHLLTPATCKITAFLFTGI